MVGKDEVREDTRRSFIFDNNTYYINSPTSEAIRKADWHYSKVYNEAMAAGILTQSEMEEILRVRGMIGDDYAEEKSKVQEELREKVVELELARASHASDELILDLAVTVRKTRERLYELNQRLNSPISNTCEGRAEEERIDYLVSTMIENQDGSKVWSGDPKKGITPYDQFVVDSRRAFTGRSKYEVMLWMQGLEGDFLEKTPESVAFKFLEEKRNAELAEAFRQLTEADTKALEQAATVSEVQNTVEVTGAKPEETKEVKKKSKKV